MNAIDKLKQELAYLQEHNRKWIESFNDCMRYQSRGIECEKVNDFSGAISAYRECLAHNELVADIIGDLRCIYSVERLAIIYRKMRLYDEEQQVLEYALKHELSDKYRLKFLERYRKSMLLQAKSEGK